MKPFLITKNILLGGDKPLLIAGPCAIESEAITFQAAEYLKKLFSRMDVPFVFKASYDKANRTSGTSFRGLGLEKGLRILEKIKKQLNVPVLTDVHEAAHVNEIAAVADVLQIPAFLCRQTDLLKAAAKSGRAVNIKKGQFMAPDDMQYAMEKVTHEKNKKVFVTERGTSFGYHNLVVDMRGLAIMREKSPVIFDLTHSVQIPGGLKGKSGGAKEFAPVLGRAAAAAGVDGFFIETHPNPAHALSDGPNMIALKDMEKLVAQLTQISYLVKKNKYV